MIAKLILEDGTEFIGKVRSGERQWQGGHNKNAENYADLSTKNHKTYLLFEVGPKKGGKKNG
jgi:hypothetical protein